MSTDANSLSPDNTPGGQRQAGYDILPVSAFSDNYLWLIVHGEQAAVVDPGDGQAILKVLQTRRLKLTDILITHHHADHTGGIKVLQEKTGAKVIGPKSANIPLVEKPVAEGDTFSVLGINIKVMEVPGHTLDHIAYYIDLLTTGGQSAPRLFCGDTLFAGGCGRVFEGSYAQMRISLEKLGNLPPETLVYCAHEYTQANLRFAQAVEPANEFLAQRIALVKELRQHNRPTVPSTLTDELASNPFLRYDERPVIAATESRTGHKANTADEVFAAIREWKDNF